MTAPASGRAWTSFAAHGAFHLEEGELAELRALFAAHSIGEHETEMTIRGLFAETGVMIDPHTAVGLAAARRGACRTRR